METINQKIFIKAKPEEVYNAILDPKLHEKFTKSGATGGMKVGGKFTAYDGYISGTIVRLDKSKKIVQKWTCSDFPKGHYSDVTFEFKAEKEGTELIFTQTGVPEDNYDDILQGWEDFYWLPLKKFLER